MKILSAAQKYKIAEAKQICSEYASLISDGTKPGAAKQYLAGKFHCSVGKIYQVLKTA